MSELDDGRVVFSRRPGEAEGLTRCGLDHPPKVVWAFMTAPAHRPQRLAAGAIEPCKGNALRLDFTDCGTESWERFALYSKLAAA
ncbi:MAG TPA: hypothetical protein VNZ85_06950 [Caulobacter sp.]|nr:hypothetical protein [Caulobacter sp.]